MAAASLVALFACLIACAAYAEYRPVPTPGAAGIGDPLFPSLGNGGYDVRHYAIELTYPTSAPQQTVSGTVTASARATQPLSRFNLDFVGEAVGQVSVNGAIADWTLSGGELVMTPPVPIRDGSAKARRQAVMWRLKSFGVLPERSCWRSEVIPRRLKISPVKPCRWRSEARP